MERKKREGKKKKKKKKDEDSDFLTSETVREWISNGIRA